MTQLALTFTVIAILAAIFAFWLNTRKGKNGSLICKIDIMVAL